MTPGVSDRLQAPTVAVPLLGTSPVRKEGMGKVLGTAQYVDDLVLEGMIYGATVRSGVARGRIVSIRFEEVDASGRAIDWPEFTVVTAADIPGENTIVHLTKDHPCLAAGFVNHPEEPILLLAHPEKARLAAAVAAVTIRYEEMPGVFNIEDSEEGAARAAQGDESGVIWQGHGHGGGANTFKTYTMRKDQVDAPESVWKTADYVVEGEYRTGAQEQLYIENNGVIAECVVEDGRVVEVTVQGSMQCPYYLVHALEEVFHLPAEKCRVIQTETGGAFGGKEDFPSVIGSHAALLAMKAGRPVKMTYDRAEDMVATTKRHPSRTRHRTAVAGDGRLLAGEIDFAIDGGAYATLSPVVLSRGVIHAAGPYVWPYLTIHGKAMATNVAPHGAFRGFGAPQSVFAMERHMDKIALVVGITPEEVRRRNFLKQGDRTATGQLLAEPVDMQGLLTRALREADYHRKREDFRRTNVGSVVKRGMGLASFFHGSGFTGSGERRLNSLVEMEIGEDGRPVILVSSTEFGQGTNTILCQVAAQALGIAYDEVRIAQPDTRRVPNSGPTVASRTAMIVGKLVERASLQMLERLGDYLDRQDFCGGARRYLAEIGPMKVGVRYEAPVDIFWDDDAYRGDAYPAYAWAVYVAEVAVDTRTYMASVTEFHALQEVGKVLHAKLAAGQIEGGVAQGIGYALYEKCVYEKGRMMNGQMTNYIMPTSADLPAIHAHFEEVASVHGPGGAKGIGELPMDGPAPAILNAIEDAIGAAFNEIPLLPEEIFHALCGQQQGEGLDPDAVDPNYAAVVIPGARS